MTDNLSNHPPTRIFRAAAVPALDSAYRRGPEIEDQIAECLELSAAELFARLEIVDYRAAGYLRPETLVCLLGVARRENLERLESRLAERLFALCRSRVRRILQARFADADFVEEVVRDLYAEMLEQCLRRTAKSYDFWEVRFYQALTALTQNYLRKHSARRRATSLFSEMAGEDETEFAERIEDAQDFSAEFEARETSRRIFAKMPDDLRIIFILRFAEKETQKVIAERLGVSDRTIRNKLDKIAEFLNTGPKVSFKEQER